MARPLRLHVPGGFYHVTLRGNHAQPVFFRASDHALLDGIVADAISELGARVHAFCWMTNHLHMLIQVSNEPLGKVIHRIAGRYARLVQLQIPTTGHLFERRYHAALIDVDRYLLAVVRYVHMNPVKAGLVRNPADYPWSSHCAYLQMAGCRWLTTAFVLGALAGTACSAHAAYAKLMNCDDRTTPETEQLIESAANTQLIGDDDFSTRIGACARPPASRRTLDDLVAECRQRFAVSEEQLASPSKCRSYTQARAWIAHEASAGGIASICAVARRFRRSESSIRELINRHRSKQAG